MFEDCRSRNFSTHTLYLQARVGVPPCDLVGSGIHFVSLAQLIMPKLFSGALRASVTTYCTCLMLTETFVNTNEQKAYRENSYQSSDFINFTMDSPFRTSRSIVHAWLFSRCIIGIIKVLYSETQRQCGLLYKFTFLRASDVHCGWLNASVGNFSKLTFRIWLSEEPSENFLSSFSTLHWQTLSLIFWKQIKLIDTCVLWWSYTEL